MLGLHSHVFNDTKGGLRLVLSKTNRIGDTKYNM